MIRRNRISGERVIERVYQVYDFTIFCIDTAQDVIRKGIGRIHFIREEREMNDARLQGQMYKRFAIREESLIPINMCSCVCVLAVVTSNNCEALSRASAAGLPERASLAFKSIGDINKVGRSRYSYSFSTRTRRLQRKLRGCQYRVGREKLAVLRDLRDRGFGDESTCLPD